MNLTTRCPTCGTAFRVQPAQLSARGGKVRCGRCNSVFDGVKALVAETTDAAQRGPSDEQEPSPQLGLFEPARKLAAGEAANEEAPAPVFLEEPPAPRRRLWGFAATLAALALLAQAIFYFRTEIAVLLPESRPHLEAACMTLGCDVRLPRRPKLMAIDSSDLQADGRRENTIVLNAVLRNQAPFAQEYPALELTLTDERDEAVARRVLAPADYLPGMGAEQMARGISPGSDAVLRVFLDTSGLRAIGYRMYLFYP
jgi:predicted Zn finger-like uncharacterized protein